MNLYDLKLYYFTTQELTEHIERIQELMAAISGITKEYEISIYIDEREYEKQLWRLKLACEKENLPVVNELVFGNNKCIIKILPNE